MRQSLQSDIIKATLDIRQGKNLDYQKGNDIQVLKKEYLTDNMLTWASQIICAKNDTRTSINNQMNEILGFDKNTLSNGQKIICLRNYWEILSVNGNPLINGTIGTIENVRIRDRKIFRTLGGGTIKGVLCNFHTEDGDVFRNLFFDRQQILTGFKQEIDYRLVNKIKMVYKSLGKPSPIPLEANFGYAITCHKAQGSTFDKVLVWEEGFPFDREEHQRWLYTACTRPSDKLLLFKK